MDFGEIVKSSVKNVFSHKLRSFLTMLGIIIGISSVIAINAMGNGSTAEIEKQFEELGTTRITISLAPSNSKNKIPTTNDQLTLDDYEYLKSNLTNYTHIAPKFSSTSAKVNYLDSTEAKEIEIIGTTSDFETINKQEIMYGRYISEEESKLAEKIILISHTFAKKYFGFVDESVIGKTVEIKSWKGKQKFTVIGVFRNKNEEMEKYYPFEMSQVAVVPIKTALRLFNSKSISTIDVNAENKEMVKALTNIISKDFHEYRGTTDKYSVMNNLSTLDSINKVNKTMTLLISGIAAISLFVAGIGIMNIMLATVTERTREIGIRKSIGAKNRDILIQFMIEAIVLTVIGGVIGILAGWGLAEVFSKITKMETILSAASVISSVGIATTIGLIFGVYPARKASLLDPIEALTRV